MTIRRLSLIAALVAISALPAVAQSGGWTSYEMGNQRYYNGTGDSGGWNGSSYRMGNQTYSDFTGPNGQQRHCSSYQMGNQTYTNCQ